MFPQRRMTTDTPDGNYSQALNLFVRGEDGWVQIITLYSEYKSFVTKQTTYCNALRQWAKRETDPNVIGSIYYGWPEYDSQRSSPRGTC